jgi:hypothetical protein
MNSYFTLHLTLPIKQVNERLKGFIQQREARR